MKKPRVQPGGKGPRDSSLASTVQSRESEIVIVHAKTRRKLRQYPVFTILRRLAAVAAAVQYVIISMSATWWALQVLGGANNPTETLRVFESGIIGDYAGDGLISASPLVQEVLGGDTTPRSHVLFLESEATTSNESCSEVPLFDSAIYNYDFLINGYLGMVSNTKYNITILDELEVVQVIVDCTFSQLVTGDPSALREYQVEAHHKRGPALVGMLTLMKDMSSSNVRQFYMAALTYPFQSAPAFEAYEFVGVTEESYLELRSIPRDPLTQPVKNLITARKRGFFNGDSQHNVRTMYSSIEGVDANRALTRWEWIGEAVAIDAWAWVHCIHFFFGLQTILSLLVLFLVTYQKVRTGKVWIGDPFAYLSTASLVMRGVLVFLSWALDSFWSINEYAMSRAAMIAGSPTVRVHKEIMSADLLVIFLSLVGFLSAIFRERIDPAIVIVLFEFIHTYRLILLESAPVVLDRIVTYSEAQYSIGIANVASVVGMSPLRLWSSFEFPTKDPTFLAASFFPMTFLLASVSLLAIARKIYHFCYPEQIRQRSSQSTDRSGTEKGVMTQRGIVTNFELSTGAELQTRFGLISDYSNYVFFKGMKFASADGVYCSGYVIVNGKMLVATKDLLSIVMIKLLRARFANVYAYEVDGHTVKETARLVFPSTFLWSDLWRLNVTVLL